MAPAGLVGRPQSGAVIVNPVSAPRWPLMAERLALRTGGWCFRNRSWLPLPWIVVLLAVRGIPMDRAWLRLLAPSLVTLGEATRLWSIRHIGVISRTRARRFGPLVNTGPYLLT